MIEKEALVPTPDEPIDQAQMAPKQRPVDRYATGKTRAVAGLLLAGASSEPEEVIGEFSARNLHRLQSDKILGGVFHYFDTADEIGTIWEISKIPADQILPPPDTEIPAQ